MNKIYLSRLYLDDIRNIADYKMEWDILRHKTMLIAGATGLIGRVLVDAIMYKNDKDLLDCHILATGRTKKKAKELFPDYYFTSECFEFLEWNIKTPMNMDGKLFDYVINLASNTHPFLYSTDPINTITSNVFGTYNLLDLCSKKRNSRFVYVSSVEIYGENRGDTDYFDENYVGYLNSNTLRANYPESKRLGETLCQAYLKEKNTDFVIARFPRVYGPTMKLDDSKASSQFLLKALRGEKIILKSEGMQKYSYLYVVDAVLGLLVVMTKGKSSEAYNVADPKCDTTLREMANYIAECAGVDVEYGQPSETEKNGYSTATKALLNGKKIEKLGWYPLYDFYGGIERTLDILKASI